MLQLVFPTSSSGFVEQSVASFHAFLRALVASSSGKQDAPLGNTGASVDLILLYSLTLPDVDLVDLSIPV